MNRILFLIASTVLTALHTEAQTVSEHGYRYIHHKKNNGPKPQKGEAMIGNVEVFVGNFLLSSSRKTGAGIYRYDIPPADAEMNHYPPIYDAALLMSVGDSLTIFQNVDDNMRQYLPPAEKEAKEIRFEITVREIVTTEQKAASAKTLDDAVQKLGQRIQTKVKAYAAGMLEAEITRRPSGLKILIEEPGKGEAIKEGEPVQVHYYGCLKNGVMFDNSYSRRQPLQFPAGVGEMIAGFDEGIMQLRHGARAYFFIPPQLGYGDQDAAGGTIPANSELIFYIELL